MGVRGEGLGVRGQGLELGLGLGVRAANPSLEDRAANPSLLAPVQTRVSNLVNKLPTYPEDIRLATELVDEWGRGFVAETDYRYAP